MATSSSQVDKYGFIKETESADTDCNSGSSQRRSSDDQKCIEQWEDMIYNWKNWMEHRRAKVRTRCCEGIPHSLRGRVWYKLSGAYDLAKSNEGVYEKLVSQPDDGSNVMKCIKLDSNRFFRNHVMFKEMDGEGQQKLKSVLKAYAYYEKSTGEYTGALGSIAAFLLLHMPPKNAFWCLVQITEQYVPGYYDHGWDQVQIELKVFNKILQKLLPSVGEFLKVYDVDPSIIAIIWFQTIFTSSVLPWETILRVFDVFLFEGREILYRVTLSTFSLTFRDKKFRESLKEPVDVFMAIKNPSIQTKALLQPDSLMAEAMELSVRMKDIEKIRNEMSKEHFTELEKEREMRKRFLS